MVADTPAPNTELTKVIARASKVEGTLFEEATSASSIYEQEGRVELLPTDL